MNSKKQEQNNPEYSGEIQPELEIKKSKTWLWILIGVLVTAVLVGWVVWTYQKAIFEAEKFALEQKVLELGKQLPPQVADETADWKIYRNEELGFSFKYPEEWRVQKNLNFINNIGPGFEENQYEFITEEDIKLGFNFRKSTLQDNENFSDWFDNNLGKYFSDGNTIFFTNEYLSGYKYIEKANAQFPAVVFNRGVSIISMSFYNDKYEYFFNIILSTFRFLDEEKNEKGEIVFNEQILLSGGHVVMSSYVEGGLKVYYKEKSGNAPEYGVFYSINGEEKELIDTIVHCIPGGAEGPTFYMTSSSNIIVLNDSCGDTMALSLSYYFINLEDFSWVRFYRNENQNFEAKFSVDSEIKEDVSWLGLDLVKEIIGEDFDLEF